MHVVGFELTIPVFERAKTLRALDRSATVITYLLTYGAEPFLRSC
jgi:hypothetical protein